MQSFLPRETNETTIKQNEETSATLLSRHTLYRSTKALQQCVCSILRLIVYVLWRLVVVSTVMGTIRSAEQHE